MRHTPTLRREAALVLDADGRCGLACVQSLGRAGIDVHIAVRARPSLTESSRWCHHVHQEPVCASTETAVEWLLDLDQRHAFRLVLAAAETPLRWLRQLPQEHALRRKAILPSNAAIDAALDKERTLEVARKLGLPVPPSRRIVRGQTPPPAEGFPRVLKPVRSKVAVGDCLVTLAVAVVRDEAARAETLAAWLPFTDVLEQEWVPGRGFGVDVLYEHGRMAWHFVHERLHEWPLTGGASPLRRAAGPETQLVEFSRRLLDELHWHGAAMVEWRRDRAGLLHLMEINPRLWGSLPLTIAAGVDVPRGLLALARGEALAAQPSWRVGMLARNLTADLQWFADNARADKSDRLLLTKPPVREALGVLRGLGPGECWDGWTWRDPAVAWHEAVSLGRRAYALVAGKIGARVALARARRRHATIMDRARTVAQPVQSVLFVCQGNRCRGPFATAAAHLRLPPLRIDSAGLHSKGSDPSPRHVIEIARSLGVDLSGWSPRRVSARAVGAADLIVAMDLPSLRQIETAYPSAKPRTTLLGLFNSEGPLEIRDPCELEPRAARQVLQQILFAIDAMARQLPSAA